MGLYPFTLQLSTVRALDSHLESPSILYQHEFWQFFADKLNIVRIIVNKNPEMVDRRNNRGETPLFIAAEVNGTLSEWSLHILNTSFWTFFRHWKFVEISD